MAAETTTNKFTLDGTEYETPDFLELEIGDWEVVYDECGVVLSDFAPPDPEKPDAEAEGARQQKLKNPRLERSFLMIAYMRAHPDATQDEAREVTKRARLIPLLESMSGGEADPPTSARKPEPSSGRNSTEKPEGSSSASESLSGPPAADLASIGITG